MARVTGIGGVFLRSHDPQRTREWYAKYLGIHAERWGANFEWSDAEPRGTGSTAWNIFPENTKYFSPSPEADAANTHAAGTPVTAANHPPQQAMINYRVDDLAALLTALQAAGVWIDPKRDDSEFGKFAWIEDCDGNRVELWQPLAKPAAPGSS
jgi:catechol 2,3-dioxygenase-like lactoylglutathione lyase family enzyme